MSGFARMAVILAVAGATMLWSCGLAAAREAKPPPQDCPKGWAYCCQGDDCLTLSIHRLGKVYFDRCWSWKPPGCWPCGKDGWFKIWEKCVARFPQVPQDQMRVCTKYYWKYDLCYKARPSGRPKP